jgi:transmembrane sensor
VRLAPKQDVGEMLAAMDWIQRLQDDSAAEKDVADWLAWYERDERHRQAFDDLQRFWIRTGQLSGSLPALESPARSFSFPDRTRWGSYARLAFAAALLLLLLLPMSVVVDERLSNSAASKSGKLDQLEVRHSVLPDGSAVDLAARSAVGVNYTAAERTLTLDRGEAFFSVAPNRARPFIVSTPNVRVRAVGTQFDVREEDDRVVVGVVEGVVDVSVVEPAGSDSTEAPGEPYGGHLRVNAGNEVTLYTRTGKSTVRTMDPERTSSWHEGRLDYIHAPLRTVVDDLNRYSYAHVSISDPDIAQLTYTGTVILRSIDEWLKAMPHEFPIRVMRNGGDILILRASDSAATSDPPATSDSQGG